MADPGLASTSEGCSARVSIAAARRFTSRTSSHASSSIMVTGTAPAMPAAWTSPPMVPSSARDFLTAAFSPPVCVTSTLRPLAFTPNSSVQRRAARRAAVPSRSQMATARPTSARARAVARPMPDAPPVTTTAVPGDDAASVWVRRRTALGARREADVEVGVRVPARGEVRGRLVTRGAVGLVLRAGAMDRSLRDLESPVGAGRARGAYRSAGGVSVCRR